MKRIYVRAEFEIDCEWEGLPPIYRIYVNDELFTERVWIWVDEFLVETLQIDAPVGIYDIRIESVGPNIAKFITRNHRVVHGKAKWNDHRTLEIGVHR